MNICKALLYLAFLQFYMKYNLVGEGGVGASILHLMSHQHATSLFLLMVN